MTSYQYVPLDGSNVLRGVAEENHEVIAFKARELGDLILRLTPYSREQTRAICALEEVVAYAAKAAIQKN